MELYMVCVLMAIAMAMVIIKGLQLILSIVHPLPSEADIRWCQNPKLPLEQHKKQIKANRNMASTSSANSKNKIKEPKQKRLPRNIRLERLYTGSPASFEEFDTSFSRRSDMDPYARSPPRCIDDYVVRHNQNHPSNMMLLEQISFAEDEIDPIDAYVVEQHQKILESHQNRSSTPIQSSRPIPGSATGQYSKSHATIV